MNTKLIGLVSVTRAMVLLLLTSWGAASARGEEQRLHHVRPLAFEANRGQADEQVKFLARGAGYTVFLTPTEAVVALGRGRSERAVVRLKAVGGSPASQIVPDGELPGVVNYSSSGPGSRSVSAPTYGRVRYVDVYPGVDLVYYGGPRQLEYDFVLAPGADPSQIALMFDGAERVEIDTGGDLVLQTGAGELRQPRPVVYQEIDGARRSVVGDYVLDGEGRVRVRLGAYDVTRPVVIDPVLAYSTYLGGSNDEADWLWGAVFGIAVDAAGNTYVTGSTTSVDFPTTPGANRTLSGSQDAFVTKLSPTGAVLYSTYLGGPCQDIANAIAVDTAGNAYVTGRAHELCYFGEGDPGVLVAKLGPTGTLLYALVFGGQWVDTSAGAAIAVDAQGHAYVTGTTTSVDFPTTPGAFRTDPCPDIYITAGFTDGFVAKVSPDGASLVYSTFLCGNGPDRPAGIALDAAGNVYVAGTTGAPDFPTVNPLQPQSNAYPWGSTGFVSKLSADGSHLIYSTYLGGSIFDTIRGLAVDGQGNAYVTGVTTSVDFPTTPGVLQPQRGNVFCLQQFCTDAFVTKINAAGSAIVYSTYLYGEGNDSGAGIAVDTAGNAYVVGTTSSLFFPIADAFQPTSRVRGPSDAFVAKLNPDGTRLVYSSYLGGSGGTSPSTGAEEGSAIAIDAAGNAYVAGSTKSYDFPTTPGAFQTTIGGGVCDYFGGPCGDAFVAKITAGGPGAVAATRVSVTPTETVPGGTMTATWAGVQIPTTDDFLLLFALGSGSETYVAYWPTGGAAAGTMTFTLPVGLASGSYEIRVLSTDPDFYNLPEAVARSRPIHVGAAAPAAADLVVASIATTPAQPAAGQPVAITVTVENQGNLGAGAFSVDFYKDRAAAPGPGIIGEVRCAIAALAAGASMQCTGTVTYVTAGTFSAWAQVDTAQAVAESNEANNVSGPRTITVAAGGPDLVVTSVGNPPASAAPGKAFAITDTVKNQGATTAAQSTTRFYLSLDAAKDAGDALLPGSRTVPTLAAGAQSAGTTTVTIPLTTPPGTYHLLACADDLQAIAEASELNNCRTAAATIVVGRPDLVETSVSNPPAAARPGTSFAVTDTVRNQGTVSASASSSHYYFSADTQKSADDRLLTGTRSVPTLAAGATSTLTVTVTIPSATPPGTYFLLACADDTKLLAESDEANNCLASVGAITVALPDLVEQTVSNSGGPFRRGTAFTVSDTAVNTSRVGTPTSATTRYYLSLDGVRNTGDILLIGARTVPILGPSASSSASVAVTIPSTTLPGTYFLLACADDTKLVAESNEANNCRASGTALVVNP